ncbi:putative ferric-chelate reductase 1 [Brachyhypopomus gauderio]|uniref:putative ferric-chelate reductase 1 n=1 Tax=Brachyhypopomus gauderio TaxID=698409 RepID=UPI0040431ACE
MEIKVLMVAVVIASAVSYTAGQLPSPTSLNTTITNSGCGTSKMCVAQPSNCIPAGNSSCYFASSTVSSNSTIFFELSGTTSGFVALGLATNQSQGPTIVFVCANNNNSFVFQTASFTNSTAGFSLINVTSVLSVQGAVNVSQSIQCTFNTTTNLTNTGSTFSYYMSIYNGNFSGSQPGVPAVVYSSNTTLNLANPSSNQSNSTTVTTTTATTSTTKGGGSSLASAGMHGLAILLSTIMLRVLC